MNSPIPTPYDIIPPPPGPLHPSLTVWGLLAAFTLITVLLLRYLARRAHAQSIPTLLSELTLELSDTATHLESRTNLERVARLSRRIITPYLSRDSASLSATELRSLASNGNNSSSNRERALSEALYLIADLEDSLYAPTGEPDDQHRQHVLVEQLTSRLTSFIRSYRPS